MSVITPMSLLASLIKVKESGKARKGVSTGFESLDELMLLNKEYLMLITGFPNFGKSEFLDALAINSMVLHDWHWLIFSTENDNYTTHLRKLVAKKVGKGLVTSSTKEITEAAQWLEPRFKWIDPRERYMTLDDVLTQTATRIESGEKIDVLLIDPWNELNHQAQTKRDDQYISDCMMRAGKFYKKYGVLFIIVIHPHSMTKDKNENIPIPHLRDCAGGAMWWNKAGYGICVHRKDFSIHGAHVYVQKVKDSTIGRQGAIFLDYDVSSGRFKDKTSSTFALPAIPEAMPFIDEKPHGNDLPF